MKYLQPCEVLDMHRTILRMVKLNLITREKGLDILIQDLKLERLGYKTLHIDGKDQFREQWKLPTGDIITLDKQFDSQIWVDI